MDNPTVAPNPLAVANASPAEQQPISEIEHLAAMRKKMFAELGIPMPEITDTQRLDRLLHCLIVGDEVFINHLEKFNALPRTIEEARDALDYAFAASDALNSTTN